MRNRFFKVVSISMLLVVVVAGMVYWQRNELLDGLLRAKLAKVEASRGVSVSYDGIRLEGLRNLQVDGLCLKPAEGDTMLMMGRAEAKVSLMNLLRRRLLLKRLRLTDVDLRLVDTSGVRNFDKLLKNKSDADTFSQVSSAPGVGYAARMSHLLTLFFRLAPEQIGIKRMEVSLRKDSVSLRAYLPDFAIDDKNYSTCVEVGDGGETQQFLLSGSFSAKHRSLDCLVSASDGRQALVPFLQPKYGVEVRFDSLRFSFREKSRSADLLRIDGEASFSRLSVRHPKLSDTLVSFSSGGIDYLLNVYQNDIELDSASVVTVGQLRFSPYVRVTPSPDLKLRLAIRKDFFPSQQLFSSLPKGLFRNLEGIATSGDLSYELDFDLDMAQVDSLRFHSFMGKRDFRIDHYGRTDFTLMNEPFHYSACEGGSVVRSFDVGDGNPDFRPLEKISPYLQWAVMYSEDGAFYGHKGFLESALTASIIRNIKEGRFARGGSTISMQLVKNLYLSKDKTLTRKLEEALIVWMIENNRLVSKQRMLEVYLNIIEWGPGIFGANEAARFYFDKEAAALTPAEAIFMASVIPRPTKFYWMFDAKNELRPYVAPHFEIVGKRMLDNGVITEQQFEDLKPSVKLVGAAKAYLKGTDAEPDGEDEEEGWSIFRKTKQFFSGLRPGK